MSLTILTPGLQTTLQGKPRAGYRHLGIPRAGAADPLALALANRLVSNPLDAAAIEITLGAFAFEADSDLTIALTGAEAPASLNDSPAPYHESLHLRRGDRLHLTPPVRGVRTYLAIAGEIKADPFLGSPSTYLPARFGGYQGRKLQAGDILDIDARWTITTLRTPVALRPTYQSSWALRAVPSTEFDVAPEDLKTALFETAFTVSRRADRMGIGLTGLTQTQETTGLMQSAPVFPGTVQLPPGGEPFILMVDAQTTGGYPRLLQVASCDLHLLGQIRPGDQVRFLHRTPEQARADLSAKEALLQDWLPEFRLTD